MKSALKKTSNYSANVMLVLLAAFFVFYYLPVTVLMRSDLIEKADDYIVMRISGYKIRGCDVVPNTAVGWSVTAGYPEETKFEFVHDLTPDSTRPFSYFDEQGFGLWKWSGLSESADSVRLTMRHNCGGIERTREIGTWPISYLVLKKGTSEAVEANLAEP
jgi:hypothetical protein